VRFLQLSDIHFVREVDGVYDLDRELQWRFFEALDEIVEDYPIDAVLVCGDLAFSGKLAEYARAGKFLRDVTSRLQIGQDTVYVIPGNHDIDRDSTDTSAQRGLRSGLRVIDSDPARDAALGAAAKDRASAELLMEPLTEYVRFAAQYDCPTTAEAPSWDRFLYLHPDLEVGLRGINSVLTSHAHDHQTNEPLVVGTGQALLEPAAGRVHVTLCHHPREWVLGADEISKRLDKYALVQVTGHTHSYKVIETGGGVWLRAGALMPSRKEAEWKPHFSVVELEPTDTDIAVTVRPWAWDSDEVAFVRGDPESVVRPLPAGKVSPSRRTELDRAAATRRLVVRLAALPSGDILTAAINAGLPPLSGTVAEPPAILGLEAASAAAGRGRLKDLWNEMNLLRGTSEDNPF
jgi:DNA repair exonuclease SbcCD nuclease subunit